MSQETNTPTTDTLDDAQLEAVSGGRTIFDQFAETGHLLAELGRGILDLPKEIGKSLRPKL